nr:diguanylate cyclase [uncultured Helicobacter sp.]
MDLSGLDLDIGNNDFFGSLDVVELEDGKTSFQPSAPITPTDATQKLNSISKQAMEALEKDDILPLPENFEAYFAKTLSQEQDENVREKIKAMVESANHDSRLIALEKTFNDNFITLKSVLEQLLILCKQLSSMESNTNKRLAEITAITNPLGAQNAIKVLLNEIKGFHKQFVTQADIISRSYRDMYAKSSTTKSSAMYDTTLGIHSKSFFLHSLELECKNGKDFPRHCALVVFSPSKELGAQLIDQTKLITTFKNIAKIVSKNIGSKDLVSYLGGGRFGMLLKNVQAQSAIDLCEEVIKKCKATNIFIGDLDLHLHIVMGGIVFDVNKTPESMLEEAKVALDEALNENKTLQFKQAENKGGGTFGADDDLDIPGDDLGDFGDFEIS